MGSPNHSFAIGRHENRHSGFHRSQIISEAPIRLPSDFGLKSNGAGYVAVIVASARRVRTEPIWPKVNSRHRAAEAGFRAVLPEDFW
jgi:hypothetical protein